MAAIPYPSRFPTGLEATYVNGPYGQSTPAPTWDGGDFRMGPQGGYYSGDRGDPNYQAPGSTPFPTGGATGGDPSSVAKNFLNKVMSGTELPFDQGTQDNMLSQASDMNSAGERARNSEMNNNAAINGASMADPSLAGARMNSMARRQSDNAMARQNIGANAQRANFAAKSGAAGTLANIGLAEDNRDDRRQAAILSGAYDTPQQGGAGNNSGRIQAYPGFAWGPDPAQQQAERVRKDKQEQNSLWSPYPGITYP